MIRKTPTAARAAAVFLSAVAVCAAALTAADRVAAAPPEPASSAAPAALPAPNFARAFLLEIDGVRRAGRAVDLPLPPASLTKMMTGLLVVEARRPLDQTVVVSRHAAAATGSRLGLRAGERLAAAELLTATLVASANDACRALAEWHSGSETAFVAAMNARAARLGLVKTVFRNACGHDAPGHLSTAAELATLARAAMAEPEFARRAGMASARVATRDGHRVFPLVNRNALIGRAPGVLGVKSGFTARAGKCIVALARRGDHEVLLVMLAAGNRWWDAHAALDYAFQRAPELPR